MGVQIGNVDVHLLCSPGTPGYEEAWFELHQQHYGRLLARLRHHYRTLGWPEPLADQMAADTAASTWEGLLDRDFRRLRVYDPKEGDFATYLRTLADEQRALAARTQARHGRRTRPGPGVAFS